MNLLDLLVSEDFCNCTAICYDDGNRKVYITYSELLQSSLELRDGLNKCVGDGKVCCVYVRGGAHAHVTVK